MSDDLVTLGTDLTHDILCVIAVLPNALISMVFLQAQPICTRDLSTGSGDEACQGTCFGHHDGAQGALGVQMLAVDGGAGRGSVVSHNTIHANMSHVVVQLLQSMHTLLVPAAVDTS